MSSQSSANKHKTSPDNRSLNNPKASSVDDTEDENEDGAHDTITSLAGAKMLQRYRRAISGSTKGSATSLSQVHIYKGPSLNDLGHFLRFLIPPSPCHPFH